MTGPAPKPPSEAAQTDEADYVDALRGTIALERQQVVELRAALAAEQARSHADCGEHLARMVEGLQVTGLSGRLRTEGGQQVLAQVARLLRESYWGPPLHPALTAPTDDPADDEPPGTPCAWCGRAIALAPDGLTWLAVKAAERGYDPNFCEAVADGWHDPLDEETTDG